MKVCTCFLLFRIFAYTNSISQIRPEGDHRVLNLPQETVSEYSYEEYSGDINNFGNVHNFITGGTTVQDKTMKLVLKAPRVETLTEFIQEAVKILNTYEDTVFEDFFHVLDKEIRRYHYRGCKFSELTQNSNTRSLLSRSLMLIRGKPVPFTKAIINEVVDMMRDETYDKNVKELLDYINSLYTNTELNLLSVLNELKYYGNTKSVRTHNNLVQVIRGGVRAVLFNPYTELNINTRRELKEKIEIFWKQLNNNPASSVEMNDIPNTDADITSVIKNSSTIPENIMNEVINPEHYSKNDPQLKLKNKRGRIVSMDTYGEQFHREETEKDVSSNESGEQITNYNTDEISSGQSFDSSSNSIKNSQERHEKYNTQRYMTLYTEEMSYKSKTTKKIEIIPISASVKTRKPKVKKRRTTMFTTMERDVSSDRTEKFEMLRANHETDDTEQNISNSSHDKEIDLTLESKHEPRARENYDKKQKHVKADESRSKNKKKNVVIISQYDAVIDVQLANTEFLKSLGMVEPLGMDTKYDTTLYPKSDGQIKPVLTESTIRPRVMRAQAEINLQKPTAPTKPSKYSKRNKPFYRNHLSELRKNIAPPLSNEGHQFMKDKNENQKYFRRSVNDTIKAEDFNTYLNKRIIALENKLNELKQMNNFSFRSRMNDNNTNGIEARNVTENFGEKYKVDSKIKVLKGNVIERLMNEDHDLINNEEVNDEHEFSIRNNTINTESSTNNNKSHKLNGIKNDAMNVTVTQLTVIDNKNTTQVTNNISSINLNVTKKLNKEVIENNVTTSAISLDKVSNKTKLESVVTTPTVGITRRTMAYSEPSYDYNSQERNRPTVHDSQMESFFDHINDGIDLRM